MSMDTETHLFRAGLMAPRMVCSSWAFLALGMESGEDFWYPESQLILGIPDTSKRFVELVQDETTHLALHNAAYDMAVLMAGDPSMVPWVFKLYTQNRVYDTKIGAQLIAIHQGNLGKHPTTGHELSYTLDNCVQLYLGRSDAKANDSYRLRYGELDGLPLELWPAEAVQYPKDDAVNTLDLALAQMATKDPNLLNMGAQARAALSLHLSSVWGQRTSASTIAKLEAKVEAKLKEAEERFKESGLLFFDKKKQQVKVNKAKVKTLVAESYGAQGKCPSCHGSGKVTSPSNKNKRNPTQINCKDCDSTGLDLSSCVSMPKTPAGAIQADRDGLTECDNDLLTEFGKVSEMKKLKETYIPWYKTGINHPINVDSNVLLESGRTSYKGLTQTNPRGHGARACFVPREGWALCSVDFKALEMATFAQAQLKIVGTSALADALNKDFDPHADFAASMIGVTYEDFMRVLKDKTHPLFKQYKLYRQGAKEGNFGFPGGMGASTLVRTARKKGTRFCTALAGAAKCGARGKVIEWNKRPTPPVCLHCVELSQKLKGQWMAKWPETDQYFDHISEIVNGSCELTQIKSERIRGGLDFCNAANSYFQGLAADGAKDCLWRVTHAMYNEQDSPLFGCRVFSFIHDEILMEVPLYKAHEASFELSRLMVSTMKEWVPDVLIVAEPALMLAWDKDAEAVYDANGRLIPWVKEGQ